LVRGVFLACLSMGAGLAATGVKAQTAAAPATAASAAETGVGTQSVVVTARKRKELMLDVPISMQAYSAQELQAQGAKSLQDIKNEAGFSFAETVNASTVSGGRAWGQLAFRGLVGDSMNWYDSSGGVFIDGIAVSGGLGSVNFIDASRVEVLKGPQNAFFGRSTFGGAINIITRDPSTHFEGQAGTSMSNRGSIDSDLTVEGPLVSGLVRGRVTVVSNHKAAIAQASDGGDLGEQGTKSVSTTLLITPSEDFWIRLRGHYQKDDDSSAAVGTVVFNGNTSCAGQTFSGSNAQGQPQPFSPVVPYNCGTVPSMGSAGVRLDANTNIPSAVYAAFVHNSLNAPFADDAPKLDHTGMARETIRTSAQLGYHLPYQMDLAVNIGHNQSNTMTIWDLDRFTAPLFINASPILTHDTTADIRLSTDPSAHLRGLLGVSYFTSLFQQSQIDYNLPFGATAPNVNTGNWQNYYSKVPALYGSVEYDITSQLTAVADARYQSDQITSTSPYDGTQVSSKKTNSLPRLSLRFSPDHDTSVYISGAEGVQPLSTNAGYSAASTAGKAYIASIVPGSSDFSPQPTLDSYEIGLKQRLFGGKLQYSLAAYQETWKNRLTNSYVFNPTGCTLATQLTAACPLLATGSYVAIGNEARIRGLELSVDGVITPQWTVGGTLDIKNAKWLRYNNATQTGLTGGTPATTTSNFNGNTVAHVPNVQASLTSTFRQELTAGWTGFVRGDLTYVGKSWVEDFNISHTSPYARVNLHLGTEKGGVTIETYVKNLFNDKHWDSVGFVTDLSNPALVSAFNFSNQTYLLGWPDPREYGVRARYNF
jgi:iron complex outermembrane receptor protein